MSKKLPKSKSKRKPRKTKPKKRIKITKKIEIRKSLKRLKIKIPKFQKQKKQITKLSFQKLINFVLQPFFKAYDDFREKRKIEKIRKIAL